ncbi:anti-sigma regulatory factor [Desulfopila inferna]|uniref:anti-sigma regulatory factor n=1 Tax=Desulfopila inferna TaxID=468528 RepID=UPI001966968E|nr:anti-sigma regulatory factor [Desulfopila inferna]MBM9606519.1 anti-sigma regulatory factor [Desulfopila inferna]
MDPEIITISADVDVMSARLKARQLAGKIGISGSDLTLLATAISEVARNIVQYAGSGEIEFSSVVVSGRRGLAVIARDQGPGIDDIEQAMQDGFTTSRGMGMGLPGAKRLMDDFEIISETGKGTIVRMVKWERSQ